MVMVYLCRSDATKMTTESNLHFLQLNQNANTSRPFPFCASISKSVRYQINLVNIYYTHIADAVNLFHMYKFYVVIGGLLISFRKLCYKKVTYGIFFAYQGFNDLA